MCGIAGFVFSSDRVRETDVNAVRQMTRRMSLRGPDAEGIWTGAGVVLGHRRLAIIDLEPRSNQPMLSADGRYCLVFNGEIYNFRELRDELEAQGEMFRTTSDSEVLIALYARYREAMLPRLRGMFAFAMWDAQSKELFLARDPYGIKPLYYAVTKEGLIFASQVKALLSTGLVSREIENGRCCRLLPMGECSRALDSVPRRAGSAGGGLCRVSRRAATDAKAVARHFYGMES